MKLKIVLLSVLLSLLAKQIQSFGFISSSDGKTVEFKPESELKEFINKNPHIRALTSTFHDSEEHLIVTTTTSRTESPIVSKKDDSLVESTTQSLEDDLDLDDSVELLTLPNTTSHSEVINRRHSPRNVTHLGVLKNSTSDQSELVIYQVDDIPKNSSVWVDIFGKNSTFDKLKKDVKEKYDMFAYNPAWIIGLSIIGTVIAVFFLGCIVAICYTRRPYRRSGKVYEIESANRKNNQIPQIPAINPATKAATVVKPNKELYY
jgi:hypothetical protein